MRGGCAEEMTGLYTRGMLRVSYDELYGALHMAMERLGLNGSGGGVVCAAVCGDDSRWGLYAWAEPVSAVCGDGGEWQRDVERGTGEGCGDGRDRAVGWAERGGESECLGFDGTGDGTGESSMGWVGLRWRIRTTGCAAGAMDGRRRSRGCSRSAGRIRWRICRRGGRRRLRWGTIRWYSRCLGRAGTWFWIWRCRSFLMGCSRLTASAGSRCRWMEGLIQAGNLTKDAAAIEASQRALPIGYWKGSGLSLVLDMVAAMLSGGRATHQIPREPVRETGSSQIFLAIDPSSIGSAEEMNRIADGIIDSLHEATPVDPGEASSVSGGADGAAS